MTQECSIPSVPHPDHSWCQMNKGEKCILSNAHHLDQYIKESTLCLNYHRNYAADYTIDNGALSMILWLQSLKYH